MKIKGLSLFIILGFSLSLLSVVASCENPKALTADQKALMKKMAFKEGMKRNEAMMLSLADKIIEDQLFLAGAFASHDFVGMATRLGERGASLVSPKYKRILGKESGQFWKNSAEEAVELQIVIASIFISDAIGPQTIQVCEPDEKTKGLVPVTYDYDAAAVVTFEFHLISKEKGTIVHNQTGIATLSYRHQGRCIWG